MKRLMIFLLNFRIQRELNAMNRAFSARDLDGAKVHNKRFVTMIMRRNALRDQMGGVM